MTEEKKFVSRGGDKLAAALAAFELDVTGWTCADFGCNVGGFTDCLLRAGAEKVLAVDTGYGELAWTLRKDPRVVVMERTNALHLDAPEAVDLVVIDVAWTPQELIVPVAAGWLKPGGLIVSLLKPHYELSRLQKRKLPRRLEDSQGEAAASRVGETLARIGFPPAAVMRSALRGKGGNREFLLLICPDISVDESEREH